MNKYFTIGLIFLLVLSSCTDKSSKKVKNLNEKKVEDTIVKEKVIKTKVEKDTLVKIVKIIPIGDSITAILSKDFFIPRMDTLRYDTAFYYDGVYVTFLNISTENPDTIKDCIKNNKNITRIDLGREGSPTYNLNVEIFNFKEKTPYVSFLLIEMVGSSDIIGTSLIGIKKNKFELVFQERAINIRKAIIKDSILKTERKFYEFTDTLELNIYTKEKQIIK